MGFSDAPRRTEDAKMRLPRRCASPVDSLSPGGAGEGGVGGELAYGAERWALGGSWAGTLTWEKNWEVWDSHGQQSTALGLWAVGWGPLVTRASWCPHPFLHSPRPWHLSPSLWHICPCPARC